MFYEVLMEKRAEAEEDKARERSKRRKVAVGVGGTLLTAAVANQRRITRMLRRLKADKVHVEPRT